MTEIDYGPYTFRDMHVPGYMMGGLERWVERGIPPGDFLCAVIRNDLRGACERADDTNIRNLAAYIAWFYNRAPSGCWGSEADFEYWKRLGGLEGARKAKKTEVDE
jgi:hypothetical protein